MKLSTVDNLSALSADQWLKAITETYVHLDKARLEKTIHTITALSHDAVSPYTLSTLAQGQHMASLLLELQPDTDVVAAALAYPTVFYAQPDMEMVTNALGQSTTKLIESTIRMESLHTLQRQQQAHSDQQIDNFRKMLLAIVDDVRVVLIKLTERLTTLRHLKHSTTDLQRTIAQQVLNFYAPLANRLGFGQLKWQLEDLAFRYIEPTHYAEITKALRLRRDERDTFIQSMIVALTQLLSQHDIHHATINGRSKHIYSIYKKSHRKQVPIEEIYDASAIRVLVETVEDCYRVLSLVHEHWPHIDSEFDDYIANPKPNGYQSIHTAIKTHDNINVEIQIRTQAMHDAAELGVAAHWKYKENRTNAQSYEEKIERLRELMQWQADVDNSTDTDLYQSLFTDRVYVFTPQGDVMDLVAGSTPLDFAYHIHTGLGHRTKGAKVNDHIAPLTQRLQTGDRVEIITSKHEQPSRDWMNANTGYLATTAARHKVRLWFKKQNHEHDLQTGLSIWEKAARPHKLKRQALESIASRFNVKSSDDLLVAIGSGNLSVHAVISALTNKPDEPIEPKLTSKKITHTQTQLNIHGVGQLMSSTANCCKPIPGDLITGFITQGRGVSIHHANCPNIRYQLSENPHRIIDVTWGENDNNQQYLIELILTAYDRQGLIRDISGVIAQEKVNFLSMNTEFDHHSNTYRIQIAIQMKPQALNELRKKLLAVDQVIAVDRA